LQEDDDDVSRRETIRTNGKGGKTTKIRGKESEREESTREEAKNRRKRQKKKHMKRKTQQTRIAYCSIRTKYTTHKLSLPSLVPTSGSRAPSSSSSAPSKPATESPMVSPPRTAKVARFRKPALPNSA